MKKTIKIIATIIFIAFIGYTITIGTQSPEEKTQNTVKSKQILQLQLSNDFNPIKKNEEVIITVTFDPERVKKVNIPNVGTATKKQLKKGKCSFTIKPEKTTKYILEFKAKYHESLPIKDDTYPFEIVVVDEKGNKIE
ncbi:hypothetical protein [uncultured Sanguibacteroides sp.]|uniref:hypothetical protein n=1 Tax=uncultured Sanguibacteroides sp. TaxID=1635151 RepID=UPI0025F7639D|nr:hypothetical protein [uncultured Sanguibacteroides sp.]